MAKSAPIVDTAHSAQAVMRPISVYDVTLTDSFLQPRRRINRDETLASQHAQCESSGRIDNFRRAAGWVDKPFSGYYFNDSDVYKWLEAVAWELGASADPALQRMADDAIKAIGGAQQPDGYLNTYFMFDLAKDRWANLKDHHEMYCAGHLIQAAVAHARATCTDSLLKIATRLADHIDSLFGPADKGKKPAACGHPEMEMALVELSRLTGEKRYLGLADSMITSRGHGQMGGEEMYQDKIPFRQVDRMIGHAVRHVYLCCGAADVVLEKDDKSLVDALDAQWRAMTQRQMYVTGGIGSRWQGEAFGKDFELPSARAYAETCAAIGSFMWNWRTLLRTGESRYADLMEWTLYNAVLPGLSLDGRHYFYQNALADDGTHRRQQWFGVACCPPNIARLLAQLPGYFYTTNNDEIWMHLYAAGKAKLKLGSGQEVNLNVSANYPWDGDISVIVATACTFTLQLRGPAWCEDQVVLSVNGSPQPIVLEKGYIRLSRTWAAGDTVRLQLPMTPRLLESHPHAAENINRGAFSRGPLLYCGESVDNADVDLRDIMVNDRETVRVVAKQDILNGIIQLTTNASVRRPDADQSLYRTASKSPATTTAALTLVPYYAWANRAAGRMQVWFARSSESSR